MLFAIQSALNKKYIHYIFFKLSFERVFKPVLYGTEFQGTTFPQYLSFKGKGRTPQFRPAGLELKR